MKWEGHRRSENIEDRRGFGRSGLGLGSGRLSIGAVVIALIGGLLFGVDPLTMLSMMTGGGVSTTQQQVSAPPPAGDVHAAFVSTVLADTEDIWVTLLRQENHAYLPPRLVLFRGATPTACGLGNAAMGPFYCPEDQRIYIDLDFFDMMSEQLQAGGDFAQAYVIAHEVGHHVQNLLGIMERVNHTRSRLPSAQTNALSVGVELQADCFAGVWAHHSQRSKGWLDQGDIEEAMNAAAQIGDDTLQRRTQGTIVPESFTHGTSAQRIGWFKRGFQTGSVDQCDTLESNPL